MGTKPYNGWKNQQTWNVALWIGNDESLYLAACDYVKQCRAAGRTARYRQFIIDAGLVGTRTPDGVSWSGTRLAVSELNAMLEEFVA